MGKYPSKQFGYFIRGLSDEDVGAFRNVDNWVNNPDLAYQDRAKIVKYLRGFKPWLTAISMGKDFFTNHYIRRIEYKDGDWQFPEGLANHVEFHNVNVPKEWYKRMERLHFIPLPHDYMLHRMPLLKFIIIQRIIWVHKWLKAF